MKTVKVRIAVVVDEAGEWTSCGFSSSTDDEMLELAMEASEENISGLTASAYWVTAELPIPAITEIAGSVEEAK